MMKESLLIGFGGDQPGYLATLWAKWLDCSSAVLFRGNDFEKIIHDSKRAWLTHFVLKEADFVGAVSQEMTRRIGSLRSGKTVYTPNGVDITEWTLFESDISKAEQWRAQTAPAGKPVVGMIGQLKAKKGLDLALTLFGSPEFRERVHLLTVGNLSEQLLEATIPESHENWSLLPFQRREQLPQFYAAVDLVFIPSIYDGMPNVLLEAMALGKVVVASSAGGIPDVIRHGENGFLFDIGDVSSVIQTVDTALSLTQEQRTAIGARARKTIAEQFTPQQEVERLERELRELETAGRQ
jgi:glycosyltransferase involved in cell wall biosynthesis